jgi:hypothetical protein
MQDQLSVCLVQGAAPLVWVDHLQVGLAFAVLLVIVTVDCYPRDVSDHVAMDSLPSGYEQVRYYRLHPVATGGKFRIHIFSRRDFQCLLGIDYISVDVAERCLGDVLGSLRFWEREYHSRRPYSCRGLSINVSESADKGSMLYMSLGVSKETGMGRVPLLAVDDEV